MGLAGRQLVGMTWGGFAVRFTADGRFLCLGGGGRHGIARRFLEVRELSVWDAFAASLCWARQWERQSLVPRVCISPDNLTILAPSFVGKTIDCVGLTDGSIDRQISTTSATESLACTPMHLITGSCDGVIAFRNGAGEIERSLTPVSGANTSVRSIAVAGEHIVAGCSTTVSSGASAKTEWSTVVIDARTMTCRSASGYGVAVAASAASSRVAALRHASRRWSVGVLEPGSETEFRTLGGGAGEGSAIAISADGRFVAAAGDDKVVHIWDLAQDTVQQFSDHVDGNVGLVGLDFSPQGVLAIANARAAGACGTLWLVDVG